VGGNALQAVLDKFYAYNSVPRQYVPIGLFHEFPALMKSLVGFPVSRQALLSVPLGGLTFFARGNGGALSVYGNTAENACLSVSLCFLSVNIEQYLECTSHCLDAFE